MYNQFQLAILATEDEIRGIRSRQTVRPRKSSENSIKRIFRLGGDRQVGRR
jgi:hypothetical protein